MTEHSLSFICICLVDRIETRPILFYLVLINRKVSLITIFQDFPQSLKEAKCDLLNNNNKKHHQHAANENEFLLIQAQSARSPKTNVP